MSVDYEDTIQSIMVNVITVTKNSKIMDALKLMVKKDIGSVVVAEKKKGLGILTERDVMKVAASNLDMLHKKVGDVMSSPLITVTEEIPVWDVFRIMLKHKFRRLPVERNGKLIGIVAERDLFRWVMIVVYEGNVPEDIRSIVKNGYKQ